MFATAPWLAGFTLGCPPTCQWSREVGVSGHLTGTGTWPENFWIPAFDEIQEEDTEELAVGALGFHRHIMKMVTGSARGRRTRNNESPAERTFIREWHQIMQALFAHFCQLRRGRIEMQIMKVRLELLAWCFLH